MVRRKDATVTGTYLAQAPSGLACCGDLPWGAHFCHLYETREDLIDTLVPFFAEGLRNHELCLWVTSEPLDAVDAAAALAVQVDDLASYLASGQLLIVDHAEWYTQAGGLAPDTLLMAWIELEQKALAGGFRGLRATGNTSFLKTLDGWTRFEGYERRVSEAFAGRRLIAMCSYHLGQTNGAHVIDVVRSHQFAVARRNGQWEVIESAALSLAKRELQKTNVELESRVTVRTSELALALTALEAQKRELEQALQARDSTERQLQAELEDARLLQRISAAIAQEEAVDGLFETLLDAAAAVMKSDFASMQQWIAARDELELIGHRGFTDAAAKRWAIVGADGATTCGMALKARQRVIVEDARSCDFIVGSVDAAVFEQTGIRAVQTTPLLSRAGHLVGMISTHWREPHRPGERELRLLDVIARQAADLIERSGTIASLRVQAQQLLEADHRKNEFLATLAHELRNPLAPIRNGLAVLRTGRAELAGRVLPMMERQLGYMVRLIDDLLDVSRVSRGLITLQREAVKLQTIVELAVETSRPLLDASSHEFSVTLPGHPVWIDGDATRLAQVISNVLNNAAKYTPEGGTIKLAAQRFAGSVEIQVTDTGIGIPDDMLDRVFDQFAQVSEALDRSQGGLGLGLSLAKRLVDMHGGAIHAESAGPQQGSSFHIRLPTIDAPEALVQPDPDGALNGIRCSLRILVVDDNRDAAESLELLLQYDGHETAVECDSTQALARALAFRPDVVFLDLGMPGLHGFDLAKLLRARPEFSSTTLVALSGWGAAEDRERSQQAGIHHHLTKPFATAELKRLLADRSVRRG